jgi:hypothetical protein
MQHIKLPLFWPNNIISLFAMAKGQFVLRNTNDELIRYYVQRSHRPARSYSQLTKVNWVFRDSSPGSDVCDQTFPGLGRESNPGPLGGRRAF